MPVTRAGGGTELGYAQITSDVVKTSGPVDVDGLTVTVTVRSRPVIVEAGGQGLANNAADAQAFIYIYEGATQLQAEEFNNRISGGRVGWGMRVRLTPSVGSHTYKVQVGFFGGTNVTVKAATTSPAWIQVTEV